MVIETRKFSEFFNGGDLENDNTTVGLEAGGNTYFNNPWTFLAPGTTGDRPAPSPAIYYRLRFNTTQLTYEYYDPILATWIELAIFDDLFTWNYVTVTPTQMVINNGYIPFNVSRLSLILPATAEIGQELAVCGKGSGGWVINQNANQAINIGNTQTTVGIGGYIESTNQYDSVKFVCTTQGTSTRWTCVGAPQSSGLTIV